MGTVAWEGAASTVWAKNWRGVESLCFAPVRYYNQLSCSILPLWEAPSLSVELLLVCLVSNLERKNTNWCVILERFFVLPHPVSKLHCAEVSVAYSLLQIFRFWLVSTVWNFSFAYYVNFFLLFLNISVQHILKRWEKVKECTYPKCCTTASVFLLIPKWYFF